MITHLLSTNLQQILQQANARLVEYVKMFTNVLLVSTFYFNKYWCLLKAIDVKSSLTSKQIVYSHLQGLI